MNTADALPLSWDSTSPSKEILHISAYYLVILVKYSIHFKFKTCGDVRTVRRCHGITRVHLSPQ